VTNCTVYSLGIWGLLFALPAQALSDADKCAAGKNKIAGQYASCRHKEEAKAILKGAVADLSKCDSKYSIKWDGTESKAEGMCPTQADEAAVHGFISTHIDTVTAALSGDGLPGCGDSVVNAVGEQCDGPDLGGHTCASLGFTNGTLTCASCSFDTSQCFSLTAIPAAPLKTGATGCSDEIGMVIPCAGTGQDGELQKGVSRDYEFDTTVPNQRTVIDNKTGLEWEVLCDQDPPDSTCPEDHDVDTEYTWDDAFTKVTAMNAASYAGHDDWRLPNIGELSTLSDYGAPSPRLDHTMFHNDCDIPPCSSDTCTCTAMSWYWTSTTLGEGEGVTTFAAFYVDFAGGGQAPVPKVGELYVRAVRSSQ